jgi:hypothetical protein
MQQGENFLLSGFLLSIVTSMILLEPEHGRAASHDPGCYQVQEGITFTLGGANKKRSSKTGYVIGTTASRFLCRNQPLG